MTVTEDNYKEIMLKRAIISCWIILVICFVIKICGGHFFNMFCDIDIVIRICNFIDRTFLKYLMYYSMYIFSLEQMLLTVSPSERIKSKRNLLFVICCTCLWLVKFAFEIFSIKINLFVLDIIDFCFIFTMLFIYSKKFWLSACMLVLVFIFTLISALTKNLGLYGVITTSSLITTIFMIDYYIMLVLARLYAKRIYIRRSK